MGIAIARHRLPRVLRRSLTNVSYRVKQPPRRDHRMHPPGLPSNEQGVARRLSDRQHRRDAREAMLALERALQDGRYRRDARAASTDCAQERVVLDLAHDTLARWLRRRLATY
jgi:hypothetical protein